MLQYARKRVFQMVFTEGGNGAFIFINLCTFLRAVVTHKECQNFYFTNRAELNRI